MPAEGEADLPRGGRAAELGEEALVRFAVVGERTATGSVRHAGILEPACTVSAGDEPTVLDVAPPIRIGPRKDDDASVKPGRMPVDVAAWVELDEDEVEGIEVWISDLKTRLPARQPTRGCLKEYIVLPSFEEKIDPVSGRRTRPRFSCAGFVQRCYAEGAGLTLVDEHNLPTVSLEVLSKIWPEVNEAAKREFVGLKGAEPWPVLLPGYLFHALNRPDISTPHRPMAEDRAFPKSTRPPP